MSKYNLTDIYEQFKAGDKFSTDFDYEGMLKAGLEAGVDTDLNTLKALSDSFEDVNYHRENSYLQKAIDALENEEPIDEVSMLFGDFHAEIKQTMKELEMDIEPTLGKFMDTQMSSMMNEDEFDEARQAAIESSQKAAGIKEIKNKDIRTALKQDAKGTDVEIDSYFTSLMKAGDTFDTMEDYVEDFQNYIADKALQEHFNRVK